MSRALKARHRARRKGGSRERLFGCDLREHLQSSGHDVPQVLRSCTQFVEQHGVVDGIYRLSGVSSNIQRLRQEFEAQRSPDLSRDVYLQDVHCVSSLCKAYCRELPNPLLTYQLYDKFADAVAIQMEEARLVKIKEVLKELPEPHYRTLEFLMRHLLRMAAHSGRTNMHARNLAIVWAPNLLRSRDIEAAGFNGTAAFMEVRVQSIVVEFILTHVEQLFGDAPLPGAGSPRRSLLLPGAAPPLHVPAVGDGPPQMRPYHTIIELGEHRSKGSLKAKKWRSIFNLGRSGHEAKRKPGKAEEKDKGGKVTLRPAKSMDSLSSGHSGHPGPDPARLLPKLSVKLRPQRQHSSDAAPAAPELDESAEEAPEAAESSTHSEPTSPKAPREGPGVCGRSRAEKCAGLHISGPFSVTVPFHITSNLSRLTRGLPCPALQRDATPGSAPEPARDPRPRSGDAEQTRLSLELRDSFAFLDCPESWLEGGGDADGAARSPGVGNGTLGIGNGTLGIEDGTPGIEDWTPGIEDATLGIDDGTPVMESETPRMEDETPGIEDGIPGIEDWTPGMEDETPGMEDETLGIQDGIPGIEDWTPEMEEGTRGIEDGTPGMEDWTPGMEEGLPAMEEGMESAFLNPGERWPEQPDSYLSIEECTEQDVFFLAPGASEPDSDPEEIFLSAHDELSPLGAGPETPEGPPGEGTALERQEIPGIPEILGASGIPETTKSPKIPEIPEVSESPKIPKVLEIPEIPGIPEIPKVPKTPEIPGISETPKIPKVLEIPEVSESAKIPKALEIPEIPEVPETPGIPEIPKVPKTPGIPEIPKVPKTPEIPGISETPKIPKVLEIPEIPGISETPKIPKVLEIPEVSEAPKMPKVPEIPEILENPKIPEIPEILARISLEKDGPGVGDPQGEGGGGEGDPRDFGGAPAAPPLAEPPREPPEPPVPGSVPGGLPEGTPSFTPTSPSAPKILELSQDEPPQNLGTPRPSEPPRSLELIQEEAPRPPKLTQDEPPKIPELFYADPPKSLQLVGPLEPPNPLDEPPKSLEPPRPLNVVQDDAPQFRDPPEPPNLIWDGRPKSLGMILTEPPKSWDSPRPLELAQAEPLKSQDLPGAPKLMWDEPPKSWDPPKSLELTLDEPPKSQDLPGAPNLIRDGRPKSLGLILAEPPKTWDNSGSPKLMWDERPKSLGSILTESPKSWDPPKSLGSLLAEPPRSCRRPLPVSGARVLLARAVPVVPPKPHFAHALQGPPGTPQIPLGPPQIPPGLSVGRAPPEQSANEC